MSNLEKRLQDASETSVSKPAAAESGLVDLSSPQALQVTRSIREAQTAQASPDSNTPFFTADARSHQLPPSNVADALPRLNLPPENAAQLQELANQRPMPSSVSDWSTKHTTLVAKAAQSGSKLRFYGDSITEYIGNGNMQAFDRNFASLKPDNFGIAGDTTTGLFKRVNDGELSGHPKAIVLMIGTNDVPTGKSADEIAQDVAKIVKTMRLHEPDTKVLVMGLLPRCAPGDPSKADDNKKIAQVNAEIKQLDNGSTVRFLDIGDKFKDAGGQARQDLLPDYLHPNNAGYQVWSDAIKPLINQMTR